MEKILVTTDMSANSKSAMRFAIQLAKQKKAELIFLHVHQVLRASSWTDKQYLNYVNKIEKNLLEDLSALVESVYHAMKITPTKHQLVVYQYIIAVEGIIKFAKDNGCSYICIGTRGAGRVRKVFGTNTSKLINQSDVPVLCIPANYRVKPITGLLYASDMNEYEQELHVVLNFAKPIKAKVEMLHLAFPYEHLADKKIVEPALKKQFRYPINLHYEKRDIERTMIQQMEKAIAKSKPSLVVMFTQHERDIFDRIFLSSRSQEFSYTTKVPLLIFKKKGHTS